MDRRCCWHASMLAASRRAHVMSARRSARCRGARVHQRTMVLMHDARCCGVCHATTAGGTQGHPGAQLAKGHWLRRSGCSCASTCSTLRCRASLRSTRHVDSEAICVTPAPGLRCVTSAPGLLRAGSAACNPSGQRQRARALLRLHEGNRDCVAGGDNVARARSAMRRAERARHACSAADCVA